MGHVVTLNLPETTVHRAEEVAQRTGRSLEAVLTEWVERGSVNGGTLLSGEHQIYTPLGGENTAQALLEYLQTKKDKSDR